MSEFKISPFLLHWNTGDLNDMDSRKKFLTRFESAVREDERKKLASFLSSLKLKNMVEFDARIEYLENENELRPNYQQIILELP